MSFNLFEERLELLKDEEKLREALQLDNDIDSLFYSSEEDSDDDEENDQLIMDLGLQESENAETLATSDSSLLSVRNSTDEDNSRNCIELPIQNELSGDKATPENTLTLNRALQQIFMNYIKEIHQALAENTQKQAKLEDNLTDDTRPKTRSGIVSVFRAPFFRDGTSYPPANEDVIMKRQSKDYDTIVLESFKEPRQLRKSAKAALQQGVVEDCLERLLKPYMHRLEGLIKKCKAAKDDLEKVTSDIKKAKERLEKSADGEDTQAIRDTIDNLETDQQEKSKEVKQYQTEITQVEEEIKDKKKTPEEELLANVDSEEVDWMKISKRNFGGNTSWIDCQKAWENDVRPTLNTSAWSKEEEKRLDNLVAKLRTGNWAKVAEGLGSGRTAFQCFSYYQRNLNPMLKSRPWTKEEDEKLLEVVGNTKEHMGFCSWRHVASMIESRSPVECMARFNKIDPRQHHGKWSTLEDAKLLAAVNLLGFSWSKISKYIGSRNMMQCRDRYVNCLAPNLNFTYFTYDEDLKLLKLYKQMGPAWSRMSPHFHGRTDSMLLGRHRTLLKWKAQKEWFDKQSVQTKRMLLGKSLSTKERKRLQDRAKDYFAVKLGITLQDYKRQDLDRAQGVDPDIIPPRPPLHLKYFSTSVSNHKNLKSWANKLTFHQRLTENLQRILKRVQEENQKKQSSKCQAEQVHAIMEEAVGQTLQTDAASMETVSKQQSRVIDSLLNKAFLREGAINVQDLLKASTVENVKRGRKRKRQSPDEETNVDIQLRNIVCRKKRCHYRLGYRRILEKDKRPASVIEQELDELDQIVPQLLLKALGTDVENLYNGAKHLRLKRHIQRNSILSVEDELKANNKYTELQKALEDITSNTDLSNERKEEKIKGVKNGIKNLKKVLKQKISEEDLIIETQLRSVYKDIEYIEDLLTSNKKSDVEREFPALYGNTVSSSRDSSATPTTSTAAGSSVSPPSPSPSPTDSTGQQVNSLASKEIEESKESDEVSSADQTPSLRRRLRSCRLMTKVIPEPEPGLKKIETWSQQKVADESAQLLEVNKMAVSDLPLLPPNYTTLRALRALLLRRNDLISKAGQLYNPNFYRRLPPRDAAKKLSPENSEESLTDMEPAAWFVPTDSKNLEEQASQFEGFTLSSSRPQFDVVVSSEVNRLKPRKTTESHKRGEPGIPILPSISRDVKPFLCDNDQKSSYRIITAPSGSLNNAQVCCQHANEGVMSPPAHDYTRRPSKRGGEKRDNLQLTNNSTAQTSAAVDVKVFVGDIDSKGKNFSLQIDDESMSASNDSPSEDSKVVSQLCPVAVDENHLKSNSNSNDASQQNVYTVHVSSGHAACPTGMLKTLTTSLVGDVSGTVEIVAAGNDSYGPTTLPQSTKKLTRYTEVSDIHLPKEKARQLMSSHKSNNGDGNVVIVGVDSDARKIVHYKGTDEKFEAFEAIDTVGVELPFGRNIGKLTEQREARFRAMKAQKNKDLINTIREQDEYKLLLARFRALLMWPVLLSTVQPSAVPDSQSSATLGYHVQVEKKVKVKTSKKKSKISLVRKEHMEKMRQASLEARRARKLQKQQLKEQTAVNVTSTGSRRGRKHKVVESKTCAEDNGGTTEKASEPDEKMSTGAQESTQENVRKPHKNLGRPKGSKNKKYEVKRIDRPKRNAHKVLEPIEKVVKESTKQMPQWWKDAMIAAMVSKKELENNGQTLEQVDISEDEDFRDKGNYSDDEWVQELRLQEK